MLPRIKRYDLSCLVSIGLLAVAAMATVTGVAADWWDINDFIYHKYAGYVLAVLSLAHVCLHWRRLVSYIRWRLRTRRYRRRSPIPVRQEEKWQQNGRGIGNDALSPREPWRKRLSRRDFVTLTLGGLGGFGIAYLRRPGPALPYGGDVGVIYHQWSKPNILSFLGQVDDWGRRPSLYKGYEMSTKISLPAPDSFQGLYTEDAIRQRRSIRAYSQQVMTLPELSRLLFLTGGINEERQGHRLRAAPSAGALYPIEVYAVIHRVENLQPGLYHYDVQEHALDLLQADDLRQEVTRHGLSQEFLGEANLVLVFTAILQRLRWKYKTRSYRYAMLEAGHLGQNVYLAGTSMGLGVCAVGAFLDDDLHELLGVDGQEEAAVYMLAVGKV